MDSSLRVCHYVRVDMGGVGWGGACVNVHVILLGKWTRLCVCRYVRVDMCGVGWGGVGHVLTFSCCEKIIRRCPLEVRSVSLVSTLFTCMNACRWL